MNLQCLTPVCHEHGSGRWTEKWDLRAGRLQLCCQQCEQGGGRWELCGFRWELRQRGWEVEAEN